MIYCCLRMSYNQSNHTPSELVTHPMLHLLHPAARYTIFFHRHHRRRVCCYLVFVQVCFSFLFTTHILVTRETHSKTIVDPPGGLARRLAGKCLDNV